MIESNDILTFGRYGKRYPQPFLGSYKGMRYRICHPKAEEGEDDVFTIDIWPEPLCFDKTDKEDIIHSTMLYSEENYLKIVPYLNEIYDLYKNKWNNSLH